ncbi:MAG: YtxH domain-containing protein [Bacteroidia bacterium]|nr:YtxH domain-containing protein [Bacteroidia bacterium]
MENSGKIIGALLLGAVVGVSMGILFAPDKGSETRKKMFNGAKDLADNLKEKIREGAEKMKEHNENSMDHHNNPMTEKA